MKRCDTCGEKFTDDFRFCPVDGNALGLTARPEQSDAINSNTAVNSNAAGFHLTLISDEGLARRLTQQVSFVINQLRQSWPAFRQDPIAFAARMFAHARRLIAQTLARPHVLSGAATAVCFVALVVLSVLFMERHSRKPSAPGELADEGQLSQTVEIDLRTVDKQSNDSGVGVGDKGRVGFAKGKGEGSKPTPARAQGGGGGGADDQRPASLGRLPVPSVIPGPISTTMARLPQALPDAGVDLDPALWRNLSSTSYGDPRSKSTTPSNGSGDGGGVGTGNGTGIGEGDGSGFGPGKKGNMGGGENKPGGAGDGGSSGSDPNDDPNRVYSPAQVTERARVLSKPEPQYTEEARRTGITGTVILRVVFSRSGEVTNIRAMQPLGGGLTERAMIAARKIRFVPAKKNGQAVSMYMQLEYNFNLY